jgi:hypothetical protein
VKVLGGEVMVRFFAMNLWRWKCGLPEITLNERLEMKEQWSKQFEVLMRHRLEVGAYRYGAIGVPGKPRYSRVESAIRRLHAYKRTGNAELLVDCANLLMLEFAEPNHPSFHFEAVDDGEHVDVLEQRD